MSSRAGTRSRSTAATVRDRSPCACAGIRRGSLVPRGALRRRGRARGVLAAGGHRAGLDARRRGTGGRHRAEAAADARRLHRANSTPLPAARARFRCEGCPPARWCTPASTSICGRIRSTGGGCPPTWCGPTPIGWPAANGWWMPSRRWRLSNQRCSLPPRPRLRIALTSRVIEVLTSLLCQHSEAPWRSIPTGCRRRAIAVDEFVAGLQAGIDSADAEAYNADFADDVMWGSPYGATVIGYDTLHAIHRGMFGIGVAVAGPRSRYETVHVTAPTPDVAIAHVRRVAMDADGEQIPIDDRVGVLRRWRCMCSVRRDGKWWLAAGQNTPIRQKT